LIRGFPDQHHVHFKDTDKNGNEVSHFSVLAPVATWEKLLNTKFSHYKLERSSELIIRTISYILPAAVAGSIKLIYPVTSFSVKMHHITQEETGEKQETREPPFKPDTIRVNPELQNIAAGGTIKTLNERAKPISTLRDRVLNEVPE